MRAVRRALLALAAAMLGPADVRAHCDITQLCPIDDDPCEVRGTHELDDGCDLDFLGRKVVVIGTITTTGLGQDFTLRSGDFTIDGGVLRARGLPADNGNPTVPGAIKIIASGPFVMEPSGPLINVDGEDGGGIVRVTAPWLDVRAGSTITADGTAGDASGGVILLASTGPDLVRIDGAITARGIGGGDSSGGYISLEAESLDVHASINTLGNGSDGGPIDLIGRAGDVTIAVDASIVARAGTSDASGGLGGTVEVDAGGSILVSGSIVSEGPGPDGAGGEVNLAATSGSVRVDHVVSVTGNGSESDGGDVIVDAGTTVEINANLVATTAGGEGMGGGIDIAANGNITIPASASLKVPGGDGGGGTVLIVSRSAVLLAGSVDAGGSGEGTGGDITVEGCTVQIDGTLDAEPSGPVSAGTISVTGTAIAIGATAKLLAEPAIDPPVGFLSTNAFTLKSGLPMVSGTAVIQPWYDLRFEPLLRSCCGNLILDADEICDDGNQARCDGCDDECRPEPDCPDDGNSCTDDCDESLGCVYLPLMDTPCTSDGNGCTGDVCVLGTCVHPQLPCNDDLPCTLDVCTPATGCVSTPDHGACNDNNECTADTCDPVDGCTHVDLPNLTSCDDDDLCSRDDKCLDGQCVGAGIPLECDDNDPCTAGVCNPLVGCLQVEDPIACPCTDGGSPLPAGTRCVDGDICTTPDTCDGAGQCVAGATCDDGDTCTTDVCFLVCLHVDDQCTNTCAGAQDGTLCSDGAVCTVGTCQANACVSTPRACGDTEPCDGIDFCEEPLGCRESFPPDDPRCFVIPLDAFTCYKARIAAGTGFTPVTGLPVTAPFDGFPVDVRKPSGLCLPTSYGGNDPTAKLHDDHLTVYKVRASTGAPRFTRVRGVTLDNQLGTIVLDAVSRVGLATPAAMSLGAPPGEPVLPNPDSFFCYKAVTTSGAPRFEKLTNVPIVDRFGPANVDVLKPTRLCAPVDLANEDPTVPATHLTYLTCYKTKPTASRQFLPRVVAVNDRFPGQNLYLSKRLEVCLPSERVLP